MAKGIYGIINRVLFCFKVFTGGFYAHCFYRRHGRRACCAGYQPGSAADTELIGLGTNALATAAMLKAGLKRVATGENAVCVTAQTADIIVGPIGIVLPNAMLGEVTPRMAEAVASSRARKLLLPVSQSHFEFIGVENKSIGVLVKEAAEKIVEIASNKN